MPKMNVQEMPIGDIKPYERNPRKNAAAVDYVANSIKEFGFKQPIVVDADHVIVVGHTRWLAAKKLKMKTVPVLVADDLTPEQAKAYRLADNKTNEFSEWDDDLLDLEMDGILDIDMGSLGFTFGDAPDDGSPDWFDREERDGDKTEGESEEYAEFVDKFKLKKTTDDCYTPELVYEAVAEWVKNEYGVDRERFVRPFYPGGDYQKEKYPEGCVVVDNPPFSILAEILNWYMENEVRFFLFAPTLTLFSSTSQNCCAIPTGASVVYENGASVNTSFVTNMEDDGLRVRTAPTLCKAVQEASDETQRALHKELPKYFYPPEVITSAMVARWSKYGVDFRLPVSESEPISALDAQKEVDKAIYGKGYILSERMTEQAAAAQAAAAQKWELSERERDIVRRLSETAKTGD